MKSAKKTMKSQILRRKMETQRIRNERERVRKEEEETEGVIGGEGVMKSELG